ncbi:hypothetical protein ACFLU6_05485 [Acidobacteriota bacterium]
MIEKERLSQLTARQSEIERQLRDLRSKNLEGRFESFMQKGDIGSNCLNKEQSLLADIEDIIKMAERVKAERVVPCEWKIFDFEIACAEQTLERVQQEFNEAEAVLKEKTAEFAEATRAHKKAENSLLGMQEHVQLLKVHREAP